jgi:hypothetical protein
MGFNSALKGLIYQEMSVADIENLHVFVPYLSENFITFLGHFISIFKMHRFCAVVVRMTGSVATFCRLFGQKKLILRKKHRLRAFYNRELERPFGILMEKKKRKTVA